MSEIQDLEDEEIAKMADCVICKSREHLWHDWGNLSFRPESCGCSNCRIQVWDIKEWNNHMAKLGGKA